MNLFEFVKLKAALAKNFHIQPTEIDKMPYWEYELFVEQLSNLVKEENDNQKAEMDKYDIDNIKKISNPSYMNKTISSMQPKMPSMPTLPKIG